MAVYRTVQPDYFEADFTLANFQQLLIAVQNKKASQYLYWNQTGLRLINKIQYIITTIFGWLGFTNRANPFLINSVILKSLYYAEAHGFFSSTQIHVLVVNVNHLIQQRKINVSREVAAAFQEIAALDPNAPLKHRDTLKLSLQSKLITFNSFYASQLVPGYWVRRKLRKDNLPFATFFGATYLTLIQIELKRNNNLMAFKLLQKAVALDNPDKSFQERLRTLATQIVGSLSQALQKQFCQQIKDIYKQLAQRAFLLGEFQTAILYWDAILSRNPTIAEKNECLLKAALCALENISVEAADKYVNQLNPTEPSHEKGLKQILAIWAARGLYEKIIQFYEKNKQACFLEEYKNACIMKGNLLAQKPTASLNALDKWTGIQNPMPESHVLETIQFYEKLLPLQESELESNWIQNLINAYELANETGKSINFLTELLMRFPNSPKRQQLFETIFTNWLKKGSHYLIIKFFKITHDKKDVQPFCIKAHIAVGNRLFKEYENTSPYANGLSSEPVENNKLSNALGHYEQAWFIIDQDTSTSIHQKAEHVTQTWYKNMVKARALLNDTELNAEFSDTNAKKPKFHHRRTQSVL